MVEGIFLKSIRFQDLDKWYVEYYLKEKHLESRFNMISLKQLISPVKRLVKKDDYNGDLPIVDKIVFKTGKIVFRKENKTGMNLYSLENNELLVSNINFHQGATALNTFGNIVASTHYQPYQIKTEIINSNYLLKILRSETFLDMVAGKKAQGIKNESGYDFIGTFKVPVPLLEEQKSIVQKYNNAIIEAERLEKQAENELLNIEKYIHEVTCIPVINDEIETKLLSFSKFSELLEKWTITPLMAEINQKLAFSKYPLYTVSRCLNCVTRSWKKVEEKNDTFQYVEIGGIDVEKESITSTTVEVKKAPSRATQIVKEGDLIFGLTRPYLKKFAIVDDSHNDNVCSSGFQVIAPSEKYNSEYVLEIFKSNICVSQFKEAMTGALYPALNADQLGAIRIPLPSLPIQEEIVSHINKIKSNIKSLRKQATVLREKAKQDFENTVFN